MDNLVEGQKETTCSFSPLSLFLLVWIMTKLTKWFVSSLNSVRTKGETCGRCWTLSSPPFTATVARGLRDWWGDWRICVNFNASAMEHRQVCRGEFDFYSGVCAFDWVQINDDDAVARFRMRKDDSNRAIPWAISPTSICLSNSCGNRRTGQIQRCERCQRPRSGRVWNSHLQTGLSSSKSCFFFLLLTINRHHRPLHFRSNRQFIANSYVRYVSRSTISAHTNSLRSTRLTSVGLRSIRRTLTTWKSYNCSGKAFETIR